MNLQQTQISKGQKENNPATFNFHPLFHWDFGLLRFNGDRRTRLGFSLVSVSREERKIDLRVIFYLFFIERYINLALLCFNGDGGFELN